jgi:hypothetical protein
VNSKLEVDIAILRALLKKAEKENIKHSENKTDPAVAQLRLALEWNRVDIAKKFIFTDEVKDRVMKKKTFISYRKNKILN